MTAWSGAGPWSEWIDSELDSIRGAGRWRHLRPIDANGPSGILDGRPVVSFAGNDYLGLASHPAVIAAAREAVERWGTGATASRLVVGTRPGHEALEADLAEWKGAEAALVFSTGYQANLGVLTTLGGPGVLVVSDELNHASLIDGCRLSRSEVAVFSHGDLDQADALLAEHGRGRRSLVVVDAVFSMDGDEADVTGLAEVCARRGALLVLDEAHSVLGPMVPGDLACEVVRVGTLSKALGSLGGFVAGSRPLVDLLVNRARTFIFTTGLTPADVAAAGQALRIVRSEEGDDLVCRLEGHIDRLAPGHPSPIVPIVIGGEAEAVAAAEALLDEGCWVPAIRPPTVAPGTSRLRVALSAAHSDEQMGRLIRALGRLGLVDRVR